MHSIGERARASCISLRPTNANSTKTLYPYNAANCVTQLDNKKPDNTTLSSFQYHYGDVGNRTQLTDSLLQTDNQNYDNATISFEDLALRLTHDLHGFWVPPTAP